MNEIINKLDYYIKNNDEKSFNIYKENLNEITQCLIKCLLKDKELNIKKNFLETILINHISFIKEAIQSKDSELLINQLIWEIKSYTNMGIPNIFFLKILEYFVLTLENRFENNYYNLTNIYKYILSIFDLLVIEAKKKVDEKTYDEYKELIEELTSSLIEPSISKAVLISNNFIKEKEDIKIFWEKIILPAMYKIGSKWSNGEITVGQEHTATSICQKVMSIHYDKILNINFIKESIIVAISPQELHQVGARMLSDILELNNYNVFFFDSNLSSEKLSETIDKEAIRNVILSTTLVSNIEATNKLIEELKQKYQNKIKIYVGGQAYSSNKYLIETTNADIYASNIEVLLKELENNSYD